MYLKFGLQRKSTSSKLRSVATNTKMDNGTKLKTGYDEMIIVTGH